VDTFKRSGWARIPTSLRDFEREGEGAAPGMDTEDPTLLFTQGSNRRRARQTHG
jgi:hypothetical protein